ncbi:hypothetical protein SELMODRAFT_269321 [Selaginella moellendorffii]|uniref:Eukaryotic translation initiation factor 3 subunit G n=1 Tax=Selaginella moellendorffii TaxID=88036 RepID=D8SWT6_SELML|nr:eukaryotic translation initiation factor 3 subunit G [Selaginella moellendorffii]XP_002993769.1 eukaryotic translation initiation factor 3 subunit G [Selaginella moellendorffii]EFJ05188.1 hypothetical protein SELMODRAFT_272337 [Selaginella moellendorffii]EFJ11149.1 hypothetical protein SELMODRAFT_269321 [Selaginella moellendorffii]|eukprot:XP_002987846.1 eukaryotic translation initiation factor 3 subunit G [Selaginella moellendorffii]
MSFRWGDAEDDDYGLEDVVPSTQIVGPDEKGIKIITEWRKNEDTGKLSKLITTVRVKKQVKKMNPAVLQRRQLSKFGDAIGQNASDNFTVISIDEITLERPRTDGQTNKQDENEFAALQGAPGSNPSLVVCRACGKKGDHWTSRCPYKDLLGKNLSFDKPEDDVPGLPSAASGAPGKPTSYVPPSLRGGAKREGDSMRHGSRDDSNSIRVTNLSEDTREQDLQELFRPFGNISRIYVAFDRETGLSRGFAFINFVNRDDAVRAIKKLDGYGYDNLILRVEWATPKDK